MTTEYPQFLARKISALEARRESIRAATEGILVNAREQRGGRSPLTRPEQERIAAAQRDLADTDAELAELRRDLDRCPDWDKLPGARAGGAARAASSAARLSPLGHDHEQLRRAFAQVGRGETAVLTARGFSTATGLIPPDLGPILPVFPTHEQRLLTRLPGIAIDVPALAYIEVTSVTGNAGIVLEGQPKPEITIPGVQKVATARKIAAHLGLSWEAYSGDYGAFVSACQGELMGKLTDAENQQLFAGTGEANGQVNGLTTNPLILALDGSTFTEPPGPWDAIEAAIALMRAAAAKAEPNLLLTTPGTWSAIRRVTNEMGNYYATTDPTNGETDNAWGIPVLVSTQFTPGVVVLVDTTRYGRVVVREAITTRIGYSGSDFTDNIIRFVSEERLTQTIERPHAICKITGMPSVAALEGESAASTAKTSAK